MLENRNYALTGVLYGDWAGVYGNCGRDARQENKDQEDYRRASDCCPMGFVLWSNNDIVGNYDCEYGDG